MQKGSRDFMNSNEKKCEASSARALAAGLVSVVVPVYNAEHFLGKSIESVTNQSYKNIELILVNDGSTDNSETICNTYALADNRIKVISQENSGPAAARNTGIRHATGDFVFFLDADDFIDRNALALLVAQYNEYKPDLVMGNFCKRENNGETVNIRATFHPDDKPFEGKIKKLTKSDIVSYVRHFLKHPSNHLISYCWARLYKLSVIKNNNIYAHEDMRLFEDFVFNLEYLKHTNEIIFVNEPLYTYTMHNSHVSASMAIVNGDSLLHDMNIFRAKTAEFFQTVNTGTLSADTVDKEIGHALIHYVIIFFIRSCRLFTRDNRRKIYNEIDKITHAPILRGSLPYYAPSKGNSRVLPLLMKLKLIDLVVFVCRFKAYKRYGKRKIA